MTYCERCGGIFSKDMTTHEIDGKKYHAYCSWKVLKEKENKYFKEQDDATQVRRKKWFANLLPRK